MTLRSVVSYGGLLLSDLRLERGAEEREGAIPLDAPQPGLDVHERGRQPALLLVRGAPAMGDPAVSWLSR
jgi:hypothetical protein